MRELYINIYIYVYRWIIGQSDDHRSQTDMWTNTHAHTDAKRPNVLLEYKHTQTRTHIHMEPGAEADTMPGGSCYMACAMDRVTVVIGCHTQL